MLEAAGLGPSKGIAFCSMLTLPGSVPLNGRSHLSGGWFSNTLDFLSGFSSLVGPLWAARPLAWGSRGCILCVDAEDTPCWAGTSTRTLRKGRVALGGSFRFLESVSLVQNDAQKGPGLTWVTGSSLKRI